MAKYIECEALLKSDNWQNLKSDFDKARAHIIILGQPAADVVEVVHGEWIVAEDDYGICATEFTCSHCKVSLVTSELTDGQFLDMMKYCPNCGADMRGERKCEDG